MKKEPKNKQSVPVNGEKRPKKTALLVLLLVILCICGAVCGVIVYKKSQVNTLIAQQNYVASKLLEIGSYTEGRSLAEQTEQKSANGISEVLIVLAAGFSADFDEALALADTFAADRDTALLGDARAAVADALARMTPAEGSVESFVAADTAFLDDTARDALLSVLLRVQGEINVKKTAAALLAMQELLSGGYISDDNRAALEEDNSLLAKKVQLLSAIRDNDYEAAYGAASALFSADSSFENRAALANLAATGYVSLDGTAAAENGAVSAQQEKLDTLYNAYYELQNRYYNTADEKELKSLSDRMQETQNEIDAVLAEMVREPVKRAINFIETTTPLPQRNTAMYHIELSHLYFRAGNEERAAALLIGTLTDFGTPESSGKQDAVDRTLAALIDDYRSGSNRGYTQSDNRSRLWQRIADILGIRDSSGNGGYFGEDNNTSYYDFVLGILSRIYRGLNIRSIDASAFPLVRVIVNVATDDEKSTKMKKNDFTVLDMDAPVSVRLLDADTPETDPPLSVMLVIDRSGSMMGKPMEDTKNAVMNFIRETNETASIGVTVFDDRAQIIAPLGTNRTELLRVTNAITDGGGTDIQAGLITAGEALSSAVGRRIIILLSDGVDGGGSTIDAVLDDLTASNICVYSIGFGGADASYLSHIAERTGGKFLSADSSALLADIYASIGEYMVNDYILEFEAVTDTENFTRQLQIQADTSGAVTDSRYNVGVSYEEILAEAAQPPAYNSYRQTGGSAY